MKRTKWLQETWKMRFKEAYQNGVLKCEACSPILLFIGHVPKNDSSGRYSRINTTMFYIKLLPVYIRTLLFYVARTKP